MRREGRVGGKPTNHSKKTGKCKVVGCTQCHESLPLNKSRGKGKGRIKRLVSDIPSTHLLSDWRVKPNGSRKVLERPDMDFEEDYDGGVEPEGWALSISLLLETALKHIHQESVEAREYTEVEVGKDDTDDDDEAEEVPDVEDFKNEYEVFKNEYEVFKHEIERGHYSVVVAESIDSWSGIELSDADESSVGNWEDDWSIVGEGEEIAV